MLCSRCPTAHTQYFSQRKEGSADLPREIFTQSYELWAWNIHHFSSSKSYSMSSFLAMIRHEYGCCRLINGAAVPVHYYGTFTICLIPFLQITWALLIMFPWGEQQLIGKESGEIKKKFRKEHWLLKYIKYGFLRQGGKGTAGPLISLGRGRRAQAPRWATPLLLQKATSLELPRDLEDPLFFFPFFPHICIVSITIYTTQYPSYFWGTPPS